MVLTRGNEKNIIKLIFYDKKKFATDRRDKPSNTMAATNRYMAFCPLSRSRGVPTVVSIRGDTHSRPLIIPKTSKTEGTNY